MKGITWEIIVLMIVILPFNSPTFAQGLSGWMNYNYSSTKQYENGKKTGSSDTSYQNYYLSLDKPITSLISSQFYLRTSVRDSHTTSAEGQTTTTYGRSIEPSLDASLRNPIYNLSGGYRRVEDFSAAHLRNENRRTTDYRYTRFDMRPEGLPTLSLQFDQNKNYDYLSPQTVDATDTRYFANSTFSYRPFNLMYNFTHSHNKDEVVESIQDSYNHIYKLDYSRSFWGGKIPVSTSYQGNHVKNKNKQGALTDYFTFFTQGLNFNTGLRPITKLNLSFNYFMDRVDENPESFGGSLGGLFENIFSKSGMQQKDEMESTITRSLGSACMWETHRLLTTTLRYQRNDSYDNKNETDFSSSTYSLAFNSSPLETLDATLSLIRSDQSSFDKKQVTNNSYLLSVVLTPYGNARTVTDMGYTRSKSHITGILSNTKYYSSTFDAPLRKNLFITTTNSFNWTSSDGTSSRARDNNIVLTYRPSHIINLSSNFRSSKTDGDTTTSEGFLVDWLPWPAIRLNFNYQQTNAPGPVKSRTINSQGTWYITRFMDVQFTYGYTRNVQEVKATSHNFGLILNIRL